MVLNYLIYWVKPTEKFLSGLIRDDPGIHEANSVLREAGIHTNPQIL
jgi:hypothetical protein